MTDLHELIQDAVAGIDPADRLEAIQARTAEPGRAARPWWYAAGGVVLATAAAVTLVAVVGGDDPGRDPHDHHVATDPTGLPGQVVAAYFVGDSRDGARLFREFDTVPEGDPLQHALERIQRVPSDPDYRTTWADGSFESATLGDGVIEVELGDGGLPAPDGIAAQQLVYTLQAAAGARLPVQLVDDGRPSGEPYEAAPERSVLNPVSISDPAEGNAYHGSLTARGRALGGVLSWALATERGVVRDGEVPLREGLRPWEVTVDLGGLPAGTYVFSVHDCSRYAYCQSSPDTRTITVR